jgi:TolA-binding protein
VLLGHIAFARGEVETASERFDEVVRDFIATPSYLPGILGLAQVNSVLGYHDESQREYRRLSGMLAEIDGHPRISREMIAISLVDRHDAAIATGQLELALGYARLAEEFFARPDVPSDVLARIAATSRQVADNLLDESRRAAESGDPDAPEHAIALQRQSHRMYQQAGEYFIRHARKLAGLPENDEAWATSLWLGSESYDRGGLHDLAVKHLDEYLAGRSPQDPRRAQVNLRLAKAHHALQQYAEAARYYRQVINEHPRSMEATQSYVPLARALVMINRRPEAEQLLASVIAGTQPIQPDAADYRDALIELGRIQYHGGNHRAAIERLEEAVKRYPNDPRHTDLLFKLGDSYRLLALLLAERVREPSAESPGERRRLRELMTDHFERAFTLFDHVCDAYGRRDQRTLDRMQRDALRASFIYRADCAFELGRYEQSIQLYDLAARRYADHHSSMHALVQIVNAYVALGDAGRAEAAHRRALTRLQQLRDEAFEAPDSLMDRSAWERWLEHTPVGTHHMTRVPG